MVVLVTTRAEGKNFVMTSSTSAEVSHEPPILVTSICPERHTHDKIIKRGSFAINLLSIKQKALAMACGSCSGRNVNKFEKFKIPFKLSEGDLPFIQGCLANIGCQLIATYRHGDHTIFVGKMFEADVYGERTVRHLLFSDITTRLPGGIGNFVKKFPIFHLMKRLIDTNRYKK